ncbi:MAG: hypothetical protein WBB82_15205 [Limnothrix sp.]
MKVKSLDCHHYSPQAYQELCDGLEVPFSIKTIIPLYRSLYMYLHLDACDPINDNLLPYLDLSTNTKLIFDISLMYTLFFSYLLPYSRSLYNSLFQVTQQIQKINLDAKNHFLKLIDELPPVDDSTQLELWLRYEMEIWRRHFTQAMIEHRNIGHDWQWTKEQRKILQNYWDENRLLLECLQSADIRHDVREWIETTMFLPMSEIEKMPPPEL